ncbi:NADPH-dependent FMN reductase [Phaeacidiphilus oryzae]|uniref:NADPH-dependent FMN reductase n=1 Tax=Phaeacidiphilus oryzae TaxID=348818 RepID=UPI00056A3450|nr:NADPH-dependent FMN reductase [Phaeacidiphilus oryzae]
MSQIVSVSGSPSATSRTARLLRHVDARLTAHGHVVTPLAVRELPAGPLLAGDTSDPEIAAAAELVSRADGLVIGTPIYKASYSGLLKTLLDLLPQYALAEKTVLPLATGGSTAHVLAIDYALRPVLTSMGAGHVLPGWFVLDREIAHAPALPVVTASETERQLHGVVDRFSAALPGAPLLAASA